MERSAMRNLHKESGNCNKKVFYPFPSFSSLLRIENMNPADARQQTIKTSHSCHSSTEFQSKPPTNSSLFPTAVASSQPPCMSPWKRDGATFDTNDRPIGLKKSSAIVSIR